MFTPPELTLIVVGSLTIPITISVITCIAITPRFHKVMYYMQVCLAVCELICAVNYTLVAVRPGDLFCRVLGAVHSFFMDASICWVVLISVHCYLTVMKGAKVATLYWKYYNVYAWGVPTLLVASGFIVRHTKGIQVFGPAGGYCQVADNDLRLYIFYVELWAHFLIIIVLYTLMFIKVLSVMSQDTGFVSSGQVEPRDTVISTQQVTTVTGRQYKNSRHLSISYIGDSIQRHSGSFTPQSPGHQGMTTIFSNSHKGGTSVFSNSYVKSVVFRAVLIAGGFILVWTPPTVGRMMQFEKEPIPEWFLVWITVSFSMMGIWNSVVFFVTSYWTEIGLAFAANPIEVEAMGSNDGFDVQ